MKTKKLKKKLTLNKKTIADLAKNEMGKIEAGKLSGRSCPNYITCTCGTFCGIPC